MQQAPPQILSPVAVVGMAARFAGADNVEQYWTNLVEGVESVSRPDGPESGAGGEGRDGTHIRAMAKVRDIEWFDADYFRVPPTEALIMDPQQRVLLEVAAEALEDAGYAGDRDAVVGVFVGSGENHYRREHVAPSEAVAARTGDVRVTLANEKDFLAPRLAFKLGFTGPAITVQTGCATALSAVALACSALAAGDCDIALAGGVSLLMPDDDGYTYTDGGILSADGRCRTFDAAASGTVPGSGAGIVVLKRDADARADGDHRRAVVRGWAVNNDGGSRGGFTVPNIGGQEQVIRSALARAGVTPDEVGYIEAHGTGTAIGDPVEFEALQRVFATPGRPARSLKLGAVKPNIGHTDAAAGVAGLIKATLAVERATVPGTLHFRSPNPEIDLASSPFVISSDTVPWSGDGARIAGVSSFGLGGSNAHVVVESASGTRPSAPGRPRQVLALSARSDEEVDRMRHRLADRLDSMTGLDSGALADAAYTLAVGRARFPRRWAAVVGDVSEAVTCLRAGSEPDRPIARWSLSIQGTPDQLSELGHRLVATERLMASVLSELTGRAEIGDLPPEKAGALAALGVAGMLLRLGLTFSRIDAPAWVRPAADWLAAGGDPASLPAALDACTAGEGGAVREGVGQITVGPSFDLADVAAAAWRAGVSVNWAAYYGGETRRRMSLPTYPFTRRRFWLERPEAEPESSGQALPRPVDRPRALSITGHVEKVWREVLGIEHIDHDANFMDALGGDSLHAVEIGARLNEELGTEFPVDLPFIAPTISDTAAFIEKALATEATS
ncbi:hypothetical protein K7472_07650 [Streptomyces sp. PTM05]|uniref:Uncharacterized protein n=1 Tax=Streptantibioticus parmotrematis TaxID=2873249 RepID=A0ABS7QP61_9ACTN|nr:type I polyketide synthase [Streptantibioticus parmotrematis]MBY8884718.1 hypothetical protein [Streptantibioticus parmotrematis]